MRYWQKICIVLVVIVIYILLINLFSSLILITHDNGIIKNKGDGADVKIGVSDSVNVQVIRKSKILWRTYEYNGDSYIKIFNIVKLPKKVGIINFIYFHIIFLIILIIFILNEIGKQNVYKEQPPY